MRKPKFGPPLPQFFRYYGRGQTYCPVSNKWGGINGLRLLLSKMVFSGKGVFYNQSFINGSKNFICGFKDGKGVIGRLIKRGTE